MPEKNKTYRARIEGYTSEGLGVARIDGQAVFVHRALRGEDCDVLILKVLKNAAFGKAVRVYAPSPHRVEPDCPYYGRCGGCDFRHMDREEELEAKRQRVQDALRRIGGSDVTVEGILSGAPLHYRNKSQYPVSADGQVGFYKARSHQVIPVDCCRIQKPQADAAAEALRRYIRECGVPCYDERTRRGLVRHLYVRTNSAGQSLVCVLVNGRKLPREDTLVSFMRQALPDAVGVVLGVNTQPTGAVLGSEYRTLWGADVLEDTLCGLSFRLSVPSFYQVNHDMAEVLYDTAVDFAGLTGHETVLDLYCGAGTITQVMARRAARVIGAEIVPEAIADAKAFCDEKGIKYIEKNGTTTAEVQMAAEALVAAGVKAVFTPTDNTVMTAELSIYETFTDAGVMHFTGADSFALNGAFVGYGVDYVQLGEATADMVVELLCGGKTPADLPYQTFDNGIVTINTESCEALGLDLDTVKEAFKPYCTEIVVVTTQENF